MSYDPNAGMDAIWLTRYYDVKEGEKPPEQTITPENCGHEKGGCVWDMCPKCHKHTLHKFIGSKEDVLRVIDIERCEKPGCGYLSEKKIMGR